MKETPMEVTEEERMLDEKSQIKTKKRDYKIVESVLLLVLGILIGFSVKTEAAKKITIGSKDYLVSQKDTSAYDINVIQKTLLAKGESTGISSPVQQGGSCGQ